MEPRTPNSSVPLRAKRSTLFSGDRYNNNGSQCRRQSDMRNFPVSDHEPTPRDSNSVKTCQICGKKFIRMFRQKKECHGCGLTACRKCFKESCRCSDTTGKGSRRPGLNPSVPLSLFDLKRYEECPRFWQCRLSAPTSIFRCRDREVSANLSIGEDAVINFRTQLTPSRSCSCGGGVSQKAFQKTEFHFDALRKQKFSRWTTASFIMDYLAVGETWLFVSLSGMASTFYGVTKIHIRRLQKFRRVNETLNIVCRNEDDDMVRIRGSFCWKIYNEEFDGPAPISSSPPRSAAIVSGCDRLSSIKLAPTLNELRSYYENYLFMGKNHELKLIEDNPEPSRTDHEVESGFESSGSTTTTESNSRQYLKPISTQQSIPSKSRTAMRLQIGTSRKDPPNALKMTRVRQILRIMDSVSYKYPDSSNQVSLLCPLCTKPVLCLNKSPSREVKNIPYQKDTLSRDQSWSKIDLFN